VLLALGAVLGETPAHLPFLGPPAARRGSTAAITPTTSDAAGPARAPAARPAAP